MPFTPTAEPAPRLVFLDFAAVQSHLALIASFWLALNFSRSPEEMEQNLVLGT